MEPFLRDWLERHEHFHRELISAPRDSDEHLRRLVGRVLDHYHEYYAAKSRAAAGDVLSLFFPSWLTSYECTFLWISGWKPSLAFRLLRAAVTPLTEPEQRAVGELQRETALAERELTEELARVQEAFAMPQVLGYVPGVLRGPAREEAVGELVGDLERLVVAADALRARTVYNLVGILSPVQSVDFLAAAAELHFCIRRWGSRRDG